MKKRLITLIVAIIMMGLCITSAYAEEKEYETATIIWDYLLEQNYSEIIAAAILGNIMAEAGGQTLDIDATIGSRDYYGICQWSYKYCSDVFNKNLEEQLDYLNKTMEKEFNTFGSQYKSNFKFSDFLEMTDVREAALAFSKCYERNAPGSYFVRQENAVVAYEYFVEKQQCLHCIRMAQSCGHMELLQKLQRYQPIRLVKV